MPRRGELDRRAFIFPEQSGWLCGTGSLRVRVKRGINSRAVYHALAYAETVTWLKNHSVGTTMPNINATIVSNIPISLPEENRIDEVVESIEELEKSILNAEQKRITELQLKREMVNRLLE